MAAALERLRRRADFLRVAAAKRRWAAPGLVLQVCRRGDAGAPRVGFTASRKVGNSVTRNRARRRLRAAADRVLPGCAAPGHDYVLIARAATPERRFEALLGDLEKALDRCGGRRVPPPSENEPK